MNKQIDLLKVARELVPQRSRMEKQYTSKALADLCVAWLEGVVTTNQCLLAMGRKKNMGSGALYAMFKGLQKSIEAKEIRITQIK